MREIADEFELPPSLDTFWANRGYYGSVYHDVAATYVLYLGWFRYFDQGSGSRILAPRSE